MDKPHAFVFFGRSGSGKGTQAHLLNTYLEEHTGRDVLYVETGKKFREFMEGEGLTSKLTKDIISDGGLMPEFLPIWIWSEYIVKNFTGNEHLVLDGVSRRVEEAPILDSALRFYKFEKPHIIYINVSRERAFEMMKGRGRADDTDEYIKSRLDWFDSEVMPAIDYFRNSNYYNFVDVNGGQSIEEVHKEVVEKVFGS